MLNIFGLPAYAELLLSLIIKCVSRVDPEAFKIYCVKITVKSHYWNTLLEYTVNL